MHHLAMSGISAFAVLLAGLPAIAAPLGQGTTPSGDAFVSACAGNGFGGTGQTGDAISGGTSFSIGSPPGVEAQTCVPQQSASPGGSATTGTVSASGSNYGNNYNNSAIATAVAGTVHLSASNTGNTGTQFAGAAAQGGWNDSPVPVGGTPGTQGILPVKVMVTGSLLAQGPGSGGTAYLSVQVYENQSGLQPYGNSQNLAAYNAFVAANSAYNPTTNTTQVGEGSVYFSWDYQMKPYSIRWDVGDPGSQTQMTVNELVWFFLPVTWGTPIEIGTYGLVQAGEAANGAPSGTNTSSADFIDTITWAGVGQPLNADGTPSGISNFSLISPTTGLDYTQSFVAPEPSSTALLATGMIGLMRVRRRLARRAGERTRV